MKQSQENLDAVLHWRSKYEKARTDVRLCQEERDALQAEVDSLKSVKIAYDEWSDKTDWVQATATVKELGKHRADVISERFATLQSDLSKARELLHEALQIDESADLWHRVSEFLAHQSAPGAKRDQPCSPT